MKTKKMPVALGRGGGPTTKSEFLIPALCGTEEDVLIGLKSGRRYTCGAISYIGGEITAEDILMKVHELSCSREEAIEKLNRFIDQLQRFRVGNIISAWQRSDGYLKLVKEAERPSTVKINLP
jgi:hypothetical protein